MIVNAILITPLILKKALPSDLLSASVRTTKCRLLHLYYNGADEKKQGNSDNSPCLYDKAPVPLSLDLDIRGEPEEVFVLGKHRLNEVP